VAIFGPDEPVRISCGEEINTVSSGQPVQREFVGQSRSLAGLRSSCARDVRMATDVAEVMLKKASKLLETVSNPIYWNGLRHGIAPTLEHKLALKGLNVRTVLDVGANKGQFSLLARCLYPAATIYAFEPLQRPAERFRALFADQANVHLFQVGIGEALGDIKMFVANDHHASSSILKAHKQSRFGSRETGEERVRVGRLNDFLPLDRICPPCLLKIDVQGYELQVINGCREALPLVDYLYVECCYVELYACQALAHEILRQLGEFGFALRGTFNQHHDPKEGPVIADFLFQSLRSMAAGRSGLVEATTLPR
jgi:FkbM family methyltransferase